VEQSVSSVDGVLVHLPPPGQRPSRHPLRGGTRLRSGDPRRQPVPGDHPVRRRASVGPWLTALGGLVAALGLLLWVPSGPLDGGGHGLGAMAVFGVGGVVMVAGLALTMADRAPDPAD
jgi:hypothetical protein